MYERSGPDHEPRLHIESWSPEYGSPSEVGEEPSTSSTVDPHVETGEWGPLEGSGADGPGEVAFVDGVRRIEARLTLDLPERPAPGLMAAFGVGAVVWDRAARRSVFTGLRAERVVVMAGGHHVDTGMIGGLVMNSASIPGDDSADLIAHVQARMRAAEGELAARLARPGRLVVADGTLRRPASAPIVGYIKTHQVMYLGGAEGAVIGRLRAGQRTPLFLIDTPQLPHYAWYLRLADLPGGHSWTGIARCEVAAAVGLQAAREVAGWTADLLPGLSSQRHIDARAPQNLVPIAALERELRKSLGDARLADRALRTAVYGGRLAGVGGGG